MKSIKIPNEDSEELAEFIGILFGDGYMNHYPKHKYMIEIAGDSNNDFDYHNKYIKELIHKLFYLYPNFRIRKNQNTLYSQILSKRIFEFLEQKGMHKGKKKSLKIPDWIIENKTYSIAFIKGLFDTDGSLILRKRKQNSVSWGFKDKKLSLDLKATLEKLDYFVTFDKEIRNDKRGFVSKLYRVRINRKK